MQKKVFNRMRTMILQDGNANVVQEKLKDFDFIKKENIKRLKENDELEL